MKSRDNKICFKFALLWEKKQTSNLTDVAIIDKDDEDEEAAEEAVGDDRSEETDLPDSDDEVEFDDESESELDVVDESVDDEADDDLRIGGNDAAVDVVKQLSSSFTSSQSARVAWPSPLLSTTAAAVGVELILTLRRSPPLRRLLPPVLDVGLIVDVIIDESCCFSTFGCCCCCCVCSTPTFSSIDNSNSSLQPPPFLDERLLFFDDDKDNDGPYLFFFLKFK